MKKLKKENVGIVYQAIPREKIMKDAKSDIDLYLIEHGKFSALYDGQNVVVILIHRDAKNKPVIRAEKFTQRQFFRYFDIPEEKAMCVGELQ